MLPFFWKKERKTKKTCHINPNDWDSSKAFLLSDQRERLYGSGASPPTPGATREKMPNRI